MKTPLLSIGLAVCALPAFSQKVTTITPVSTNSGPVTNSVTIPAGQAARVVTVHPVQWNYCSCGGPVEPTIAPYGAFLVKDGAQIEFFKGDVIEGPATFFIVGQGNPGPTGVGNAMLTIERWRVPKIVPVRVN